MAFFMIYFLGFDILFTALISLMWLTVPTFNFAFLLSSDSFKEKIIANHMWLVYTLSFFQLFFIVILWQLTTGGFTEYFEMNTSLSSVFVTAFEIMNYALQSGLFVTYVYFLRADEGIVGFY